MTTATLACLPLLVALAFGADDPFLDHLREAEGLRLEPYRDTLGWWTIGYGHRCHADQHPITRAQAEVLLAQDAANARAIARRIIPTLDTHPPAVRLAVESMAFQLGAKGLLGFANFRKHLEQRDYAKAALDMVQSRWHAQTPTRCRNLAAGVAKATP